MVNTKETIKAKIRRFIQKNGGILSRWYVGITEEPKTRLESHNVKVAWIHIRASSHIVARNVEEYFIKLGTDGGTGGGDEDATYIYAYKKKPYTTP